MEWTQDEKLAVLEAMQKQIKPQLEDLKSEARYDLLDTFNETGADRRAILIEGSKVGEVGISYSKPKPTINMSRYEAAIAYLESIGMVEKTPVSGWEKVFAKVGGHIVNEETGDIVDDLFDWQPSVAKGASVRGCKPEVVFDAIKPKLENVSIVNMLEG